MGRGLLSPRIVNYSELLWGVVTTLSFAVQGMAVAILVGFTLSLFWRCWWVRGFCAFIRAIHELFWALLFIQLFGLSPLTGLLAIALPYAGMLAKIYGELFEEMPLQPRGNLINSKNLSAFLYTTLPQAWPALGHYTRYRFECALRSTVVLGFVGLPTLGFYLETALNEGLYSEAAGLLYALLLIIASQRWWLRKRLMPIYLLAAVMVVPPSASFSWHTVALFFTEDIVPQALRTGRTYELGSWLLFMWQQQIWPGLSATLILSQLALFFTAVLALLAFPFNSRLFVGPALRWGGSGLLIIARTLPEYLLAYIGLLLWGPSMLPAIVALAVHNGAIVAHLLAHYSVPLGLRDDACTGLNRYAYEVLPRMYRHFLAVLFYRWELIIRESAILGILGITTLGFYIDSAFEEFRFDRAALLILSSAWLNMAVDMLGRKLRRSLHLTAMEQTH